MTRFLTVLSRSLAILACLALVGVMMVTFVDVMGRYFFSAPLTYAVELIQLGVGITVLSGLALTTLERGHIAVDLVERLIPNSVAKVLASFAAIAGFAFISIIAWQLWNRAVSFREQGLATDILFLPVWPVVMVMSIAGGCAALVALVQILRPGLGAVEEQLDVYD